MRILIVVILTILSMSAFAASPSAVIFAHECKATNDANTGLRCGVSGGKMVLHWTTEKKDMTKEQLAQSKYEYSRIITRYFDLGGRQFSVTGKHWPKGAFRYCSILPSRAVHCYTCDGTGKACK